MLENLVLRQQLAVLKQRNPRPRLRSIDKVFWVGIKRFWSEWKNPLVIVTPETVVRWHRAGFRQYWRWREILCCVAEGNQAFAKMCFSGRHVAAFRGYEPTGKHLQWLGAALFRFEDSVIAELWVLGDLAGLDALLKTASGRE
jgi:hypothetical protein